LSDDQPFYSPTHRPPPAREPTPGLEVWRLRKGDRVLVCELRDDDKAGAGIDVQILSPDRWPLFTQRCTTQAGADFVAASYRRDYLRDGWTE
jgi:hypothetical protein